MKYNQSKKNRNYPNFHITNVDSDILIDLQNGGLDDVEEFNCSMYNFGDMDDLPDSDKLMIRSDKICKEYRNIQ